MATFLIGDVHGCFATLRRLLERIGFEAGRDRVFLTGDLVNGGPDSAAVVRWAKREAAGVVLGNHDLHLLAVASGARAPRKKDTFFDLLRAEDREELLGWLRRRPLVIRDEKFLLVHAGILPEWDPEEAVRLSDEVAGILRTAGADPEFFAAMYGDEPRRWSADLEGMDRVRIVINAMTRMRMLTMDGGIDPVYKGPVAKAPSDLQPWFDVPRGAGLAAPVFFGHWAALGFHRGKNVVGLDSGCVWGGRLTAWRLEDGRTFQVESEMSHRVAD